MHRLCIVQWYDDMNWKGAERVMTYFTLLHAHLPGRTVENHENLKDSLSSDRESSMFESRPVYWQS